MAGALGPHLLANTRRPACAPLYAHPLTPTNPLNPRQPDATRLPLPACMGFRVGFGAIPSWLGIQRAAPRRDFVGIESDQVVYEYLSRVGDVAQQRQLPSGTRMRLVNELRAEIDRRRARTVVDSPAAVRRIIARLGTPDEVVTAAGASVPPVGPVGPVGSAGSTASSAASAAQGATVVPLQRDGDAKGARGGKRTKQTERIRESQTERIRESKGAGRDGAAGESRDGASASGVPAPRAAEPMRRGTVPPHLAGEAEVGEVSRFSEWWRTDRAPLGPGEGVPDGFIGGVEIPELLKAPPSDTEAADPAAAEKAGAAERTAAEPEAAPAAPAEEGGLKRRRLLSRVRGGWGSPLLLAAACLLVAGAVLGNLVVLALGWLIAWGSRRLSDTETKWAVIILPGLALAGGLVWLWGRDEGRWGEPIADGHMNDAVAETWPWVVRAAAVTSALFLVWRARRRA